MWAVLTFQSSTSCKEEDAQSVIAVVRLIVTNPLDVSKTLLWFCAWAGQCGFSHSQRQWAVAVMGEEGGGGFLSCFETFFQTKHNYLYILCELGLVVTEVLPFHNGWIMMKPTLRSFSSSLSSVQTLSNSNTVSKDSLEEIPSNLDQL